MSARNNTPNNAASNAANPKRSSRLAAKEEMRDAKAAAAAASEAEEAPTRKRGRASWSADGDDSPKTKRTPVPSPAPAPAPVAPVAPSPQKKQSPVAARPPAQVPGHPPHAPTNHFPAHPAAHAPVAHTPPHAAAGRGAAPMGASPHGAPRPVPPGVSPSPGMQQAHQRLGAGLMLKQEPPQPPHASPHMQRPQLTHPHAQPPHHVPPQPQPQPHKVKEEPRAASASVPPAPVPASASASTHLRPQPHGQAPHSAGGATRSSGVGVGVGVGVGGSGLGGSKLAARESRGKAPAGSAAGERGTVTDELRRGLGRAVEKWINARAALPGEDGGRFPSEIQRLMKLIAFEACDMRQLPEDATFVAEPGASDGQESLSKEVMTTRFRLATPEIAAPFVFEATHHTFTGSVLGTERRIEDLLWKVEFELIGFFILVFHTQTYEMGEEVERRLLQEVAQALNTHLTPSELGVLLMLAGNACRGPLAWNDVEEVCFWTANFSLPEFRGCAGA